MEAIGYVYLYFPWEIEGNIIDSKVAARFFSMITKTKNSETNSFPHFYAIDR